MTQELIERTTRDWVLSDTDRAARALRRLAREAGVTAPCSADEMVDALIRVAGQLELAETRVW